MQKNSRKSGKQKGLANNLWKMRRNWQQIDKGTMKRGLNRGEGAKKSRTPKGPAFLIATGRISR
jgi:hypothetical protein